MNDEREVFLDVLEKLVIHGDEVTPLPFRQGDVEAVVQAAPSLRGDFRRSKEKWIVSLKDGQWLENVGQEVQRITDIDQFLPLSLCETARNFRRKS